VKNASISYTDRIAGTLFAALLADEKEIAPSPDRGDQRIYSTRQHSEVWLQYVLMKAANLDSKLSLNFEDKSETGRSFTDVTAFDDKGKRLCCVEIKGPHRADPNTRRMVLRDVEKQQSGNLVGCEVSVFALVHGEGSRVDSFQKELGDEIRSDRGLSKCVVSNAGDISLNKGLDGTPHGVLRIVVIRIPSKQ
jgi:hypothetical protein